MGVWSVSHVCRFRLPDGTCRWIHIAERVCHARSRPAGGTYHIAATPRRFGAVIIQHPVGEWEQVKEKPHDCEETVVVKTCGMVPVSLIVAVSVVLCATGAELAVGDPQSSNQPFTVVAVLHDDNALARPHDIELLGDLAFVPGKGGSIAIVDIKDLANPRIVWWNNNDQLAVEDAQTVLPLGNHLFLGARDFCSVNIEDPAKPVVEERISDRPRVDRINGMVRRADFLLSANKTGWISVFDISDRSSPRLRDVLDTRRHGDLRSPHDIAVFGNHIIVADQARNSPVKVRIYRVADSTSGRLLPTDRWVVAGAVTSASLNGANRVCVRGNHAFVACSQSDNFQIGFLDITDPDDPVHLLTMPFAGVHATGLTVAGRVLFVAGGQTVQALDISEPDRPKTLAVLKTSDVFPAGRDNAHDLVYRDGHLFVTAQNDNQIGIIRVNDSRILGKASSRPSASQARDGRTVTMK